jgi:hypothetical protein
LIGAMFSIGLRGRNDWAGTYWFFLILFFGTWALGAWLRPIGPPAWDFHWIPYVIAAAVIALLLAALTPVRVPPARVPPSGDPTKDQGAVDTERQAAQAVATVGVFFWLLLAVSLLAIVLHYVSQPGATP